jgi:hypothetical protein
MELYVSEEHSSLIAACLPYTMTLVPDQEMVPFIVRAVNFIVASSLATAMLPWLCLSLQASEGAIPRCKPLKYTYEKEIVMYAYFKRLHYFSTECVFAPNAYRGHARAFLKDLEKIRPTTIMDIIHSGKEMSS